jgi:hypothetical protein
MIATLRTLFARDLQRLHAEIAAYQSEHALWQVAGTAPNAAGNLCLHLVGNLNTYVGATLGRTGYVRDRAAERRVEGGAAPAGGGDNGRRGSHARDAT